MKQNIHTYKLLKILYKVLNTILDIIRVNFGKNTYLKESADNGVNNDSQACMDLCLEDVCQSRELRGD